jgi:succinyl-CoA synthetase beta subunit
MLGNTLVTVQTGEAGKQVNRLYVTDGVDIAKEYYLSMVVDRASGRVAMIVSTEGGMDIEEVAHATPEKIATITIDPAQGFMPTMAARWPMRSTSPAIWSSRPPSSPSSSTPRSWRSIATCSKSTRWWKPRSGGKLLVLDTKMSFDSNALYRHPEVVALRDETEEDPAEIEASKYDLAYIKLHGDIGCMVNGAGLAMATMDIIKLNGMFPANFLDVGGGATTEKVTAAFKLILSDPAVKGILVNIFGGIMKCDVIARASSPLPRK